MTRAPITFGGSRRVTIRKQSLFQVSLNTTTTVGKQIWAVREIHLLARLPLLLGPSRGALHELSSKRLSAHGYVGSSVWLQWAVVPLQVLLSFATETFLLPTFIS